MVLLCSLTVRLACRVCRVLGASDRGEAEAQRTGAPVQWRRVETDCRSTGRDRHLPDHWYARTLWCLLMPGVVCGTCLCTCARTHGAVLTRCGGDLLRTGKMYIRTPKPQAHAHVQKEESIAQAQDVTLTVRVVLPRWHRAG